METTIFAVKAHVVCAFASFRFAKDYRYHRTYILPPKTTLIGFLGAALGLNENELYHEWRGDKPLVDRVSVAVILKSMKGRVRDIWKTVKNKGNEIVKTVITREQLYRPEYTIYTTTEDSGLLNDIQGHINDPVFPLSLGRDDELALVTVVKQVELTPAKVPVLLHDTILPFDFGQIRTTKL